MKNLSKNHILIILTTLLLFFPFFSVALLVVPIAIYALINKQRRKKIFSQKYSRLLLGFLAFAFLSAIIHLNWLGCAATIAYACIITFMLFINEEMNQDLFSKTTDLICYLSTASFLIACIQKIMFPECRPDATYFNPNYFGYMAELFAMIAIYKMIIYPKKRLLFLSIAIINVGSIIICDCRNALLGISVGFITYIIFYKKYFILPVIGGIGCTLAAIAHFLPKFMPRITSQSLSHAAQQRDIIWETAWKSFKLSPLFGNGAYSYYSLWDFFGDGYYTYHAHNLLLNCLADFGIIGTILLLGYFILILIRRIKTGTQASDKPITALILSCYMVTAAHCVTDIPILGVQTSILFLLILSGAKILTNKK